jgi:hypothetical protein
MTRKSQIPLPRQLGPCHAGEFAPPVRDFIYRLQPLLTEKELKNLKKAEGKWPNYPLLITHLAHRHGLPIPTMTLPGPPSYWDKYRVKGPGQITAVPEDLLN